MTDVLAAEWLKLRSVASTRFTLLAVACGVVAGALLAWYVAGLWDGLPVERQARMQASPMELVAEMVAQMSMAVLGVLAVTSEYATGMIRTTLAAVPRRVPLLAAKAVVVGGIALAAGTAGVVLTFLADRAIIGDRPLGDRSATVAEAAGQLLASGLGVMVFALVGLGLGVVTRSTAGGITAMVALWYLLPIVALNLPEPWGARVGSVMLPNLARQLGGTDPDGLLAPPVALAAMAAWVVVALGTAALALRRRDA
jgi:hypothetical protein